MKLSNVNTVHPNRSHTTRAILAILIPFVLILCILSCVMSLWGLSVDELFTFINTSRQVPDALNRFSQIQNEIHLLLDDNLVEENVVEAINVYPRYPSCVRGLIENTFISEDSPYEDIVRALTAELEAKGWSHYEGRQQNTVFFLNPDQTIRVGILPTDLISSTEHQVAYRIRFRYAEPSLDSCTG